MNAPLFSSIRRGSTLPGAFLVLALAASSLLVDEVSAQTCTNAERGLTDYDTGGFSSTLSLSDDSVSSQISLGFTFSYFGTSFTTAVVSSNGYIFLGAGSGQNGCCSGGTIPSDDGINNIISGYWHDIFPPGAGAVRTATLGTAPNRRFVVWFDRVPDCCTNTLTSANTNDFQIVLFEGSNNFEVRVRQGGSNGRIATIGYENANGSVGHQFYRSSTNIANRTFTATCGSQVNRPPTVTQVPSQSGVVGTAVSVQVQASDPDGDTLTYSATGLPPGLTINTSTGLISGTPSVGSNGTHTVNVTVNDGRGGTASTQFTFTITVPIGCTSYTNAERGLTDYDTAGFSSTLSLSDDQVSSQIPLGFTFNYFGTNFTTAVVSSNGYIFLGAGSGANGCCSGRPIPTNDDINNIISGYWHDIFPPGAGSLRFATLGTAPNRRFVVWFDRIPDCCTNTLSNTNTNDFQIVLFEATGNFEMRVRQGGSNGRLATVGYENASGTGGHQFYHSSTNIANRTFVATCAGQQQQNRPPSISQVPSQTGIEGTAVSLQISASDPDNDTLTYAATGLPTGLTINTTTGRITGTPSVGTAGTHNVTVTVNDGRGGTASAQFTFTIASDSPPTVSLTAPAETWHNSGVQVVGTVTDTGCGQNPVIQSTNGLAFTRVGTQNTWTITSGSAGPGRYVPVTVTATSGCNNRSGQATRTFGVDNVGPTVTFGQMSQNGVNPNDISTWPTFAKLGSVPMVVLGRDDASGIAQMTATVVELDNNNNAIALFSQTVQISGQLPTGPLVLPASACTNQTHCLDGNLRFRGLTGGRFRLDIQLRDAAGNVATDSRLFRSLGLRESIVAWRDAAAALTSQVPNATVQLTRAQTAFTTSLVGFDEAFFGNITLALQTAQASLNSARIFDNNIVLTRPDALAAVTALNLEAFLTDRLTTHRTNNPGANVEFDTATGFLEQARLSTEVITSVNFSANAYFFMEEGANRMIVDDRDFGDSQVLLNRIINEMDTYITNDPPMVGRTQIADARTELSDVLLSINRIVSNGDTSIDDLAHANLLISLTNTAEDLRDAQLLATWVRNWQWGLTQIVYLYADRGLRNAASFVGIDNPVLQRGQQNLILADGHRQARRADDFMQLLINSRCTVIAIYNRVYNPDLAPPQACCAELAQFILLDPLVPSSPRCANRPPTLTNPGNRTDNVGQVISLQIQATDLDNNTLTYSATGLPTGLTINTTTGLISGTLSSVNGSPFQVTVSANDGFDSGSVTFVWTVVQNSGISYTASFVLNQDSVPQCTAWNTFRGQLSANTTYTRVTLRGSRNTTGFSCTGATANTLCQRIRADDRTLSRFTCDGRTWSIGGCGAGIELSVNTFELNNTSEGICRCLDNPNLGTVRPCINVGNPNWGGMNGGTCSSSNPSQTLEVICQ